jgi:hypothetical protein
MSASPRSLRRRVSFLLKARPRLRARAAADALDHYRRHRQLPPGYVTRLLTAAAVRRIRLRGEIEHMLRISRILLNFAEWRRRA